MWKLLLIGTTGMPQKSPCPPTDRREHPGAGGRSALFSPGMRLDGPIHSRPEQKASLKLTNIPFRVGIPISIYKPLGMLNACFPVLGSRSSIGDCGRASDHEPKKSAPVAMARGGEQQAQTPGGRHESGRGHAAGQPSTRALKPGQKRELAVDLVLRYGAGCERLALPLSSVVWCASTGRSHVTTRHWSCA
jgi:hypothetical protein